VQAAWHAPVRLLGVVMVLNVMACIVSRELDWLFFLGLPKRLFLLDVSSICSERQMMAHRKSFLFLF
jgi:hypothetical protein